jgi:tetratricopeptide (TPR) repeat protein
VVAGKQQAIQEFSKAIQLNSRYQYAYFARAIVYKQVQEFQKSLSDYNQAIIINSKFSLAYYNRALLKANNLNDRTGAIQDLRQAARLFREQVRTQDSQRAIEALRQLGATE